MRHSLKDVIAATRSYNQKQLEQAYNNADQPQSENNNDRSVCCPKCGSTSIQAVKRGYSLGGGCLGFIILLPIAFVLAIVGLIAGLFGANKVRRVCMNCKYQW